MSATKYTIVGCSVAAVLAALADLHPVELHTSPQGLELLAGYEDCRLSAYKDIVGVPTIGVGSTKDVCMGQVIDINEAARRLAADVLEAEQCVNMYFNGAYMPQQVFDSTVSLVYNVGCYGVRWNKKYSRPTMIARHAMAQDWVNVCYRFSDFTKAGGVESKGLRNRREKEQLVCRYGY